MQFFTEKSAKTPQNLDISDRPKSSNHYERETKILINCAFGLSIFMIALKYLPHILQLQKFIYIFQLVHQMHPRRARPSIGHSQFDGKIAEQIRVGQLREHHLQQHKVAVENLEFESLDLLRGTQEISNYCLKICNYFYILM